MKTSGTVKFFNVEKNFGFITEDNSTKDVFVHGSALNGLTIHEKERVEFETEESPKGLKAININLIND